METSLYCEPTLCLVDRMADLQPDLVSAVTLVNVLPNPNFSFSISSSVMLEEESVSF